MRGVANHKPDMTIYQTMINLLGKAQRMAVAESLFEGMVKEGLELGQNEFASLIVGCIRTGSLQRGIAMLEKMKEMGMHPSISTYNTLIDGLQELQRVISLLGPLI
jgi:pentatricopeptide repeat protein